GAGGDLLRADGTGGGLARGVLRLRGRRPERPHAEPGGRRGVRRGRGAGDLALDEALCRGHLEGADAPHRRRRTDRRPSPPPPASRLTVPAGSTAHGFPAVASLLD